MMYAAFRSELFAFMRVILSCLSPVHLVTAVGLEHCFVTFTVLSFVDNNVLISSSVLIYSVLCLQ